MKICKTCDVKKSLMQFHKCKSGRMGRHNQCKLCRSASKKQFYALHKDKILNKQKEYALLNKEKKAIYSKKWREINKDLLKEKKASYFQNNKKKIVDKSLLKRKTIPHYRIRHNIDSRLRQTLLGKYKSKTLNNLLGCSVDFLKLYLESKFQEGMNWDNYGRSGWHIDHIIPLAKFNLENEDNLKQAWNYTNLQPLWEIDNLKKGAK